MAESSFNRARSTDRFSARSHSWPITGYSDITRNNCRSLHFGRDDSAWVVRRGVSPPTRLLLVVQHARTPSAWIVLFAFQTSRGKIPLYRLATQDRTMRQH